MASFPMSAPTSEEAKVVTPPLAPAPAPELDEATPDCDGLDGSTSVVVPMLCGPSSSSPEVSVPIEISHATL